MTPTDLCRLAEQTKALKFPEMTQAYHRFFHEWRRRALRLLEIGVLQGGSLRMWRAYFPRAKLFAIDVDPEALACAQQIRDCTVSQVDQGDPGQLNDFVQSSGGNFDLVIDDGGHHMHQQLLSFDILFPVVKPGGAYVLEDHGTSYWNRFGGKRLGEPGTSVALLKHLVDCVNLPVMEDNLAAYWGGSTVAVTPEERAGLRNDVEALHVIRSLSIIFKTGEPGSLPANPTLSARLMSWLRGKLQAR
jgi:SAM-dependent methyltransferase